MVVFSIQSMFLHQALFSLIKMATFTLLDRVHQQSECTPSGVHVRTYTPPSSTLSYGLFIDRTGNRLVADHGNPSKVVITDKNNNLINKLATGEGQNVCQVAIAPNGDVWVVHYSNKILIYSE